MKKKWLLGLGLLVSITCFMPRQVWPTVSNTVTQTTTGYGNGVTTSFAITFDFRSNSWLTVTEFDTSTSPATQTTIPVGAGAGKYTVSGGNPGTAIVMGTAPSLTQYLVIGRNIPLTQPVVFNPASIFPYQGLSSQLDQVTLTLQNIAAGNPEGGGSGGGGGSSGNLPNPGAPYDFIGWNSAGISTVNATVAYDAGKTTFQANDILEFNGSGWATYPFTQSNLMQTLNSSPNSPLAAASGGTGVTNLSNMTWGSNPITWNTTGTTSVTLPTSGTLLAGTATNNNTASTIVKRDSSGNFSAGTVTANLAGNVVGNVVGNLTGNASGTAANVTGIVALGNGGTGQTTQQSAINGLLNSSGASAGTFARFDGVNVTLDVLKIGDVPQGFSRSKLAQGTANTIVTNDGSGNMSALAPGISGNCAVSNGVSWASATCPGGGSGTPGGVNTNVQYNSSGSFGGDSGFTYDGAGTVTATTFVGALTGNASTATTATNATKGTTVSTASNASFFPAFFASSTNGNQPFNLGTGLTFNPSTNTLATTTFSGALSGNASTATTATNSTNAATTATNSTNASFFPTFVASASSGNQGIDTASGLSFNPSTNTLTTTTFSGALSGNATNITASSNTSLTSLANLATVGTIGTGVWNGTAVDAAHGGTGLTSITAHNLIIGNGTSAATLLAPGTSGFGLISQGASSDPHWAAIMTNPMTTLGDIVYEDVTPTPTRLAGNITSTKKFLTQTGTGSVSAAPGWNTIAVTDLPSTNLVTASTSTGNFSGGSGSGSVTNATLSITTTGRPVMLFFTPDGTSDAAYIASNPTGSGTLIFKRGSTQIGYEQFNSPTGASEAILGTLGAPVIDTPAAGTYTYSVDYTNSTANLNVHDVLLNAYEMK